MTAPRPTVRTVGKTNARQGLRRHPHARAVHRAVIREATLGEDSLTRPAIAVCGTQLDADVRPTDDPVDCRKCHRATANLTRADGNAGPYPLTYYR